MNRTETLPTSTSSAPKCDGCRRPMEVMGWMPRPDGLGGLRRIAFYWCLACDRIHDEFGGHRPSCRAGAFR